MYNAMHIEVVPTPYIHMYASCKDAPNRCTILLLACFYDPHLTPTEWKNTVSDDKLLSDIVKPEITPRRRTVFSLPIHLCGTSILPQLYSVIRCITLRKLFLRYICTVSKSVISS